MWGYNATITKPLTQLGNDESGTFGKEGSTMTLIWKNLLHANFRCGRMYSARAEKETLSQSCTVPSMLRMRERM